MVGVSRFLKGAEVAGSRLAANVPGAWMQGRTCSGGLSAAFAYAAASRVADDLPPLRSATLSFLSPLDGLITAEAKLVRRGRSTAFVDTHVAGADGLGVKAGFVFMAERSSPMRCDYLPAPEAAAPESAPPAFSNGGAPGFASNFDWREAWPDARNDAPDRMLWVRLREREDEAPGVLTTASLLAVADAMPPAALLLDEGRSCSTINWMVNLLTSEPTTTNGWWLLRSIATHVGDGFSSQHMTMWNHDGACVAQGMQSIAIF